MIWPNELALLMLSLVDNPSDEIKALAVLVAILVWFAVACVPAIGLGFLINKRGVK